MGAVSNYCAVWTLAMEGTLGKEMGPQKGQVDLNKLIKSGLLKQRLFRLNLAGPSQ